MLKFWKKSGRKETPLSSTSSSPRSQSSPVSNGGFFIGGPCFPIEEVEALIKDNSTEIKRSRLSKTLDEVISDNEALAYFIQYLETVGCGALIKFILDIESFNAALKNPCNKSKTSHDGKNAAALEKILNDFTVDMTKSLSDQRNFFGTGQDVALSNDNQSDYGCERNKLAMSSEESTLKQKEENELLSRLLGCSDISDNVVDAVKIFKKYFSHNALMKIELESDIRQRLLKNLSGDISEKTFRETKEYVLKILENEHFNDYLRSEYQCKYQIDVLTSNKVFISDILYNDTALFYLMEFLEQEGCTSYLEFWIAASNFQQQYQNASKNYDPMQAQEDAMVLYDKYFSLQATNPLNLGDSIRIKVEESICREEGPLPNCFEYPQKIIVKILETKFLAPFLQSQLYFKYLSELISTIQASPVLCPRSRNSGGSDCSSEVSISATNTLLVSEDVNPPKIKFRHLNNSSMSIDMQQLYDPDSLWRRGAKKPGLNFGRVNELGRFETDLEPEPDKKSESRITKAVKKFVNLDEDKSKEEMAWQVAAMIVKDVTNVTMPHSNES